MENNLHQIETQSSPIYLKFNKLTKTAQDLIRERLKNENGSFIHNKSNNISSYIFILFGVIWCGLIFYLADDYLWKESQIIFFSVLTISAIYLLFFGIYKISKSFSSPFKKGLFVTSHYILSFNYNDLKFWTMEQLYSVNSVHNYQNGTYNSTKITFNLENGTEDIVISNLARAEEIVEQIEYGRKLFIEAVAKNNVNYLNFAPDFVELRNQKTDSKKSNTYYLIYAEVGLISVLVSVPIMYAAISANNYFDDKRSWNDAESINRASSYRKYLQTHPNGHWNNQASQKLQNLYNSAERNYQNSLNKGFDPKAVEAVKQAIFYAKQTNNYRVKLVFERHNEIPTNIVEILKKDFKVKKVLTIDDSFSDEKINAREKILSQRITQAFNVVIPNDILEFSSECNDECITFLVKYTIDSDSIYYSTLQEKEPEANRIWRPGVWFDWNFNIKTPNTPQTYNFELESDPAMEIFYDSDIDESDVGKDSFEKKMEAEKVKYFDALVESAFDDFKANLIYRMGIGEEPKKVTDNNQAETNNDKQESKKK